MSHQGGLIKSPQTPLYKGGQGGFFPLVKRGKGGLPRSLRGVYPFGKLRAGSEVLEGLAMTKQYCDTASKDPALISPREAEALEAGVCWSILLRQGYGVTGWSNDMAEKLHSSESTK